MARKESESTKNKTVKDYSTPEGAINKKTFITAKKLETVVAILLGIATLLSAWATWIGTLHGGIQSINFTKSNNMAAEGSAEYNLGLQLYLSDYMAWNVIRDYNYELETAKAEGDKAKVELIKKKIEDFKKQNISETLAEGIKWMEKNNEDNPFNMPGMSENYFESAQEKVDLSHELLEEGKRDNTKGDSYHLVTVIFSLVLFLLGIVGTFKNMPNRIAVLSIAVVALVFAVIYMLTIPLPTGFGNMNFFEFNK
ncbi:MAG: hypothetical protein IKN26_07560 [Eubacterium sp.]|nr:hypothetical protein [Eubacterium sp.]MBR4240747.1 hypothetical protein [Eubacterium sp.]